METGDTQIYDTSGNLINDQNNIEGNYIKAYDYKSTIVTNPTVESIKKGTNNQNQYWYREYNKNNSTDWSVATDNLNSNANEEHTREYYYAQHSGAAKNDDDKKYPIYAETPQFNIEIENDAKNGYGECQKNAQPEPTTIENISFGIITNPKIKLQFEKTIVNIKVTNTQGQKIIEGNPGDQNIKLKHLSNLDSRKDKLLDGSTFVKIEINDEEIYGSEIEITYALTIKNVSDSNYYEPTNSTQYGYYYKFGDKTKNVTKVWKIAADEVDDYMDERLEYNATDHKQYVYTNDDRYRKI